MCYVYKVSRVRRSSFVSRSYSCINEDYSTYIQVPGACPYASELWEL